MIYFLSMMVSEVSQEFFEFHKANIEQENQDYVDAVLDEYPTLFKELILQDGSRAAMLYNDSLIKPDDKEVLPPYKYIAFSRYGLTEFNSSFEGFLGWEITTKAIALLIEVSEGREVKDLLVCEFQKWKRNRINKGVIPLKKILRSVTVTGVHFKSGIRDFYNNILGYRNFNI